MSIYVTPDDSNDPHLIVSDDEGETIHVDPNDEGTVIITPDEEAQDPDVIAVVDQDESPDVIFVNEDDTAPIHVGEDDDPDIRIDEGPGPKGPQGEDGLSAYDVAVKEGFVGTEDEWLASLQGPQGTPGSAPQAYVHDQAIPSMVWTINHNLGYHPNVTVIDSGGTEWIGDIAHLSDNAMTITFTSPFGGKAYLS